MTDFRIVGIEIKGIGWSWGSLRDDEGEEEAVEVKTEPLDVKGEGMTAAEVAQTEPGSDSPVKKESTGASSESKVEGSAPDVPTESKDVKAASLDTVDSSETVEEKRGAKRKAKTPEGGEFPLTTIEFLNLVLRWVVGLQRTRVLH